MEKDKSKLGKFPYVIGCLSYVPLIGVVFGIVAVVWGVVTDKLGGRRLAFVGAGGIAVTVVIVGAIYSWHLHLIASNQELRIELAQDSIDILVHAVERKKEQTGTYPASLEALNQSSNGRYTLYVFDPTNIDVIGLYRQARHFHYDLVDEDHYYLLGVGPDLEPYTNDDVLPNVEIGSDSKFGLLIKRP